MIRIFKYFVQSIFIYIFFFIGKVLGISVSRKLFSRIFLFVGPLFKSKNIIDYNLKIYSSNLSNNEKNFIKSEMWKNYGMTFIEYAFLRFFQRNNSQTKIDGEEVLTRLIKQKQQAIFISGHFANYEMMSMEIVKRGVQLATIYRPLNNFFLNPLMEYLRRKYVCKNQIKKGVLGVRNAIKFLKKGHSIALMIDQRVSEGERVDFFGKPALTTTLPAQLSLKFDLPIVPVFIQRDKNNKFLIKFYNEIKFERIKNKFEITKKLNLILEDMIKKNSGQWIWTHNRWK